MTVVSHIWKELPWSAPQVKTQEEDSIYKPGNDPSPDTKSSGALMVDSATKTVKNKFLLFISYPIDIYHFVVASQTD
jgi:hypothetical protein